MSADIAHCLGIVRTAQVGESQNPEEVHALFVMRVLCLAVMPSKITANQ